MTRALLVEMFDQMVVAKDKAAIPRYYDPDFVMVSNGITQGYEAFRTGHETVYATGISYAVEYDDESWVRPTTESPSASGSRPPDRTRPPPGSRPHRDLPRRADPPALGAHLAELVDLPAFEDYEA